MFFIRLFWTEKTTNKQEEFKATFSRQYNSASDNGFFLLVSFHSAAEAHAFGFSIRSWYSMCLLNTKKCTRTYTWYAEKFTCFARPWYLSVCISFLFWINAPRNFCKSIARRLKVTRESGFDYTMRAIRIRVLSVQHQNHNWFPKAQWNPPVTHKWRAHTHSRLFVVVVVVWQCVCCHTYSLTRWLARLLVRSFARSFACLLACSVVHSLLVSPLAHEHIMHTLTQCGWFVLARQLAFLLGFTLSPSIHRHALSLSFQSQPYG